jgi:predicted Rossmann fold nucleotide-binding protein DprA/Smf involved in DNA uptake
MKHRTQAILLLTLHLGGRPASNERPLTPTEWGRFARWLYAHGLTPERLLAGDPIEFLQGFEDKKISVERIAFLLGRGAALGLALERWSRTGVWILNRADPNYPSSWLERLGAGAPPLIFGVGAAEQLQKRGVAVVGSRNATTGDLSLAAALGRQAAESGEPLISGGARGVDQASMLGALDAGGVAVGVLADSLLRASTSRLYRPHLQSGGLTLVTTFNPEARFQVGNAMARNKYIYCLSRAAVVVASSEGSGGTWQGATENLRRGWAPLWIARSEGSAGNEALVQRGARWLPDDDLVPAEAELADEADSFAEPPDEDRGPERDDHDVVPASDHGAPSVPSVVQLGLFGGSQSGGAGD